MRNGQYIALSGLAPTCLVGERSTLRGWLAMPGVMIGRSVLDPLSHSVCQCFNNVGGERLGGVRQIFSSPFSLALGGVMTARSTGKRSAHMQHGCSHRPPGSGALRRVPRIVNLTRSYERWKENCFAPCVCSVSSVQRQRTTVYGL